MRTGYCSILVPLLLLASSVARSESIPDPILLSTHDFPGQPGMVWYVGHPSVNAAGLVAFVGHNLGLGDYYYVDGVLQIQSGDALVGVPGTLNQFLRRNDKGDRRINLSGDVTYTADLDGVPTTANEVHCLNHTVLLREGDPAPGVPGQVLARFRHSVITDSGTVFVRAELDGPTTDFDAVYAIPNGGVPALLQMNSNSAFLSGAPIVGGPLDGEYWSGAFRPSTCNAAGALIVTGVLASGDRVVLRKPPGADYEVLLRAGASISTPQGAVGPITSVLPDVAGANGNDHWAGVARVGSGVGSTVMVLADVGAGLQVVAQQGQDISALTEAPGSLLGPTWDADVNASGQVVLLGWIYDATGVSQGKGVFMWQGGNLGLLMTHPAPIPGHPSITLAEPQECHVNDQGRVFVHGHGGGFLDGVFEIVPGASFVRGDCNNDASTNIADAVWLLAHLFSTGTGSAFLACESACDGNDDGALNIGDAVLVLGVLFGVSPTSLPDPLSCDVDPTTDSLPCEDSVACP
ncbi:MAG: hypothetical protein AAF581_15275 [Planctomycetota bacterium]